MRRLIWVFLWIVALVACGDKDQTDTDNRESSPVIIATPTTGGEGVVDVAPVSLPTPTLAELTTPLATLSFPAWQYAGDWSLNLNYKITEGGPFIQINEWTYSGITTIRVTEDGNVSGSGTLYAQGLDDFCIVTPNDEDGFDFTVTGTLRQDSNGQIWLDTEIIPTDYFVIESYTILCQNYTEPRTIELNYFWPMLGQIEALKYSFWVEPNLYTIVSDIDLASQTNNVLQGHLKTDLLLQR